MYEWIFESLRYETKQQPIGVGTYLGALGLRLDISAVVEQYLDDLLMARRGGQDQRGEALLVAVLNVGPAG